MSWDNQPIFKGFPPAYIGPTYWHGGCTIAPRLVIYRQNYDAKFQNTVTEEPYLRASFCLPFGLLLGFPRLAADGFDTPTTSFKFPPKIQEAYAAFPTVVGTNNSQTVTNSAPTIDLPAGIASGDLIIVFLAQDGAATATWPSPWVELVDENAGTAANLHVAYLIASGGRNNSCPHNELR